jgi:TonB family protein
VQAEETTEDDRSEAVAAPKSEDVAQLKDEVAALKAQLEELKGKQSSEDKEAQARKLAEAEAAARAAAESEARQKAEEEARKKAEGAKAENGIAPATIGMRLPSANTGPVAPAPGIYGETGPAAKDEFDALEELLPKPALDFSHAPKNVDPNDPFNIYRPERQGVGKKELVVGAAVLLVVIVAGAGAWYKNLLPFLRREPKSSVAANVAPDKVAEAPPVEHVAAAPANNLPASATSVAPEAARPVAVAPTPNPPVAAAPTPVAPILPAPIESPAERAALAEKGAMRVVAPAKSTAGKPKPAAEKGAKNHGKAQTSGESAPVPVAAEVFVSDQPIKPAKLLRAVQPIYPPDAMRNYITGDVRIEAEVDKQGRIGAMKILLGPKQFRQVAMDALKQYEYAPALQGGKPVTSKVTVTIKFWFDP